MGKEGGFGGRGASRALCAAAVCGVLVALACGLLASQALALSQRGYTPAFAFASTGEGAVSRPGGVAVNEATGHVYVVDRGNHRIVVFDSTGKFLEAWGWGVKDGAKSYEVCKAGEGCKAGLEGNKKGELTKSAEGIAVDNSTNPEDKSKGDVYVEVATQEEEGCIKEETCPVDKYGPNGELLKRIAGGLEEGSNEKFEPPLQGIAVDKNGNLLVYHEEEIFTIETEKHKRIAVVESAAEEGRPGIAVDNEGHYYVAHETEHLGAGGSVLPTVVAKLRSLGEESPGEALNLELDPEESTGVAVDNSTSEADPSRGDVFVDNVNSVAVFTPSGHELERFGSQAENGVPALLEGSGVAVDSPRGHVYVADASGDRIDAYELEPPSHPVIDELGTSKTGSNSTQLTAAINPVGASTKYAFRYQLGEGVPKPGEPCEHKTGEEGQIEGCIEVPVGGEVLGGGFGDQSVAVPVTGLEPGTTYHFIVFASNEHGTVVSGEQQFTTQLTNSGFSLPDGRQWQIVSPQNKEGGLIEPITREDGLIQAAEGGSAVTYLSTAPLPGAEGNRGPEYIQLLSRRGPSGWTSQDIATPQEAAAGAKVGVSPEYYLFSSDLSQSVLLPVTNGQVEDPPLSTEATEATPYIRTEASCEVSVTSCFTPLVTGHNVLPGREFGLKVEFLAASADLSHVVLKAPPLLAGAGSGTSLYEWSAGQLTLVSILPEEKAASGAVLGSQFVYRHAVSNDGNRVFWSAPSGSGDHLYVRDVALGKTLEVDKAAAGGSEAGTPQAKFQTASSDGSTVFFTDTQRLTANATAAPERPDLYACQIVVTEGALSCSLSDLTAHTGEAANIQGVISGANEEGTIVYFVANGALAPKAAQGHCHPVPPVEGQPKIPLQTGVLCNVYVEKFEGGAWQPPSLVGTISQSDEPDWSQAETFPDLGTMTSRVSPDGRYLTFMSENTRSLVGYDNVDLASGQPDEEVLVYDSVTGSLHCVSCNPTGSRPHGVFDTQESGEGLGLLVDRLELWEGRWLAGSVPGWTRTDVNHALYQSRYVADDGRVFFDSADALVPQDTNGKEDVYEYEPAGVGSCTEASSAFSATDGGCVSLISSGTSGRESAFVDASASGNDVFFVTAAALSKRDKDTSYDLYDAAVCGVEGTEACLPETAPTETEPCVTADQCRGGSTPPPSFASPGSLSPAGSGNVPQQEVLPAKVESKPKTPTVKKATKAQLLSKALVLCRKKHNKKQRQACEKAARKKYGAKASKARKSSRAHKSSHGGKR